MSKPSLRDRLQAAADVAAIAGKSDSDAEATIKELVREHGATYHCRPTGNTLRVCGVTASCTWSEKSGLLAAWRRNATLRLLKLDGRCE